MDSISVFYFAHSLALSVCKNISKHNVAYRMPRVLKTAIFSLLYFLKFLRRKGKESWICSQVSECSEMIAPALLY